MSRARLGCLALGIGLLAVMAGCIRSRSRLDIPRNAKMSHDLYDTLFPTRSAAGDFRARMARSGKLLNGLIEKVYTAPEWNVEIEKRREERASSGLPPEEYKIHKGARFFVEVPQDPKLSKSYQVAPDGYIDFPHLGRLYVEGLTVSQFKAMMVERLSDIIRRPEIHVNFEGFLNQAGNIKAPDLGYIYVFGEAGGGGAGMKAQRIGFTGRESLIEVLSNLGGVAESGAWDQTVVYRRQENRKVLAIVSNIQLYAQRADFMQDFPLEAQDVIYIPLEYSYTDDKIKSFLRYFLDWATLGITMDTAVQDIEKRVEERGR